MQMQITHIVQKMLASLLIIWLKNMITKRMISEIFSIILKKDGMAIDESIPNPPIIIVLKSKKHTIIILFLG